MPPKVKLGPKPPSIDTSPSPKVTPKTTPKPSPSTPTAPSSDFKTTAPKPPPVVLSPKNEVDTPSPSSPGPNLFQQDLDAIKKGKGKAVDHPEPSYWSGLDFKPGWDPDRPDPNAKFQSAWLKPGDPKFNEMKTFLENGVVAKPYTAPKREETRMQHAREQVADLSEKLKQPNLPDAERKELQLKLDAANHRLNEGRPGGPPPPSSGELEITKIKVIKNPEQWSQYQDRLGEIREQLGDDGKALDKVKWSHQDPKSGLPVLDPKVGETLLTHGTEEKYAKLIAENNFAPEKNRNRNPDPDGKPRFGALGQGTYFGDSLSKVSTYVGCPRCGSNGACACKGDDGKPLERFALVSRVAVGRPHTVRTHGELDFLPGASSQRDKTVNDLKEGRHSNYGKGVPFTLGERPSLFGSNEFLIKDKAQTYPEFVTYFRPKEPETT